MIKELQKLYGLTDELQKTILASLGNEERVRLLLRPLHPSDIAIMLQQVSTEERVQIVTALGTEFEADILYELDDIMREEVSFILGPHKVAEAISELESDEAIDILQDFDNEDLEKVLEAVSDQERFLIKESLTFPEDSAGRLMKREFISIPAHWKISTITAFLRKEENNIPEEFHTIFVVDPKHKLLGQIALSDFIRAKGTMLASDILNTEIKVIPASTDQEEVAHLFKHYNLVTAPVTDESGRMRGVITVDDIVDIVDEEAEEDMLLLSGIKEADLYDAVLDTTRARFSWLAINLLTAILASAVIAFFDGTIKEIIALAVIMPIIASMGGNAATQTLAITVRALATKELSSDRPMRIITKEALVSCVNSVLFAILAGGAAYLWSQSLNIGLITGAAMVINMVAAGLAGVLIPLSLDRLKIDPAVASSVFVTTVTDVIGFLAFLGLATAFLI
ncbi:MAG: magnesium transporter [Alphaproteobacteria bacterium]